MKKIIKLFLTMLLLTMTVSAGTQVKNLGPLQKMQFDNTLDTVKAQYHLIQIEEGDTEGTGVEFISKFLGYGIKLSLLVRKINIDTPNEGYVLVYNLTDTHP